MSTLTLVVAPIALALLAATALQVWLVRKARAVQGRPAPALADAPAAAAIAGEDAALFYFHSPGCGACRALTPAVEALRAELPGRVFPIDVSRDLDTARRFGVLATPTLTVVRRGVITEVVPGAVPPARLRALLGA